MAAASAAVAVAALLFASTFVIVKAAIEDVDPTTFLAARFLLAGVVLAPVALRRRPTPRLVRHGVACGLPLAAGYVLQTIGLRTVTASVSAFLTYLLVVLVPLASAVLRRRLPDRAVLVGAAVAAAGLWLLTGARPSLGTGELLTVGCAVAFAAHILVVGAVAAGHDAVQLNAVQLVTGGLLFLGPGLAAGGMTARAWVAAAFTGVAASAVALGLQVWGQRRIGPSRTALILMLEPVAAGALGALAGDRLGLVGWAGAALILAGIVLGELPALRRRVPAAEVS